MCWKKWAAKHEYEESNEGAWLDPSPALLRKKVRENWTEKHRNAARKIFLDGRISVSVKLARWRKAQKSTGFTTVRNGTQ